VGKNVGRERKVRRRKKCEKKKREEKIGGEKGKWNKRQVRKLKFQQI
jgi:hypothetical protein